VPELHVDVVVRFSYRNNVRDFSMIVAVNNDREILLFELGNHPVLN
jgi:hypothetical protein